MVGPAWLLAQHSKLYPSSTDRLLIFLRVFLRFAVSRDETKLATPTYINNFWGVRCVSLYIVSVKSTFLSKGLEAKYSGEGVSGG